jgi:transcriptional regulator with XRE-family HTH domain
MIAGNYTLATLLPPRSNGEPSNTLPAPRHSGTIRGFVRNGKADLFKLIAVRVRQLRGDESQESVCLRAGVSRRVLSGIEAGKRDFQMTSLLRILEALNTDLQGILEVKKRETARGFQDEMVCGQVVELLALGGATETMITSAVAQWHDLLVRSSRAASKKA